MRNTLTPAWISFTSISTLPLAGPTVATIFVRARSAGADVAEREAAGLAGEFIGNPHAEKNVCATAAA
jgi:hypothetical protein